MSERSNWGVEQADEDVLASASPEDHTYASIPEQRDAPPY
jgi:hypothetical protein